MRQTNCLWMPTAWKKPFPVATECEWGQWCWEYTWKGFDFCCCCCCANQQNFGTEPYPHPTPPFPPQKKDSSTEPSVHSQCCHIRQYRLNGLVLVTWRPLTTLPDTVSKEGYSPITEKCHSHCGPPACQPEISCCGNIWQSEYLHFIFSWLKTQKPTPGTRSRLHI